MTIPRSLQAPTWITSGATITGGLDLLGLRLPVQTLGGEILNGITTVTPTVNYLALRAWIIRRYFNDGHPNDWAAFTLFASKIETVMVLATLTQDRGIGGLIGTDQALRRLQANDQTIEISPLVITPATIVYTGPSDQLGLTTSSPHLQLTAERGHPIAEMVGSRLEKAPLIARLLTKPSLDRVTLAELEELGPSTRIDQIPSSERILLTDAIIPHHPLNRGERNRLASYTALLALAAKLGATPSESDFLDIACSADRFGEPALDDIADGWAAYCVRDSIAVTQEAVLAAVIGEVVGSVDGGVSGAESSRVISELMEQIGEHDEALSDLDLLRSGESVASLSFSQLYTRINEKAQATVTPVNGVTRWRGDLIETRLYRRALRSGAGALSLAVVAWILAVLRVQGLVREDSLKWEGLSYQGWRRLGLRDAVLPEVERFLREDRPLREVAAELAYRTVRQHLQIAWSRLQADLRRDVALIAAEDSKWFGRNKFFYAGRTASRLGQALGWLRQLGLISDDGITEDGRLILDRSLRSLLDGETK